MNKDLLARELHDHGSGLWVILRYFRAFDKLSAAEKQKSRMELILSRCCLVKSRSVSLRLVASRYFPSRLQALQLYRFSPLFRTVTVAGEIDVFEPIGLVRLGEVFAVMRPAAVL